MRQLEARLQAAVQRRLDGAGRGLGGLAGRLEAMSPLRVLDRGYALATARGHVLTDAAAVAAGDPVRVRLARGAFDCRVEAVHADEPAEAAIAEAGIADSGAGGAPQE
jgi:exodeoxyribonuclease VII large subunit